MALKKHLIPLQREKLVIIQADIDISPGEEWEQKISHFLNTAQIILLLLSPDFMASEYCYSKEMKRAVERHELGEASVIPIILRPTRWRQTALGKLQALPANAEPVTSRTWYALDEAFYDVVKSIEKVIEKLLFETSEEASQAKKQMTSSLPYEERNRLLTLEARLRARVIGQEKAIKRICQVIWVARTSLKRRNRPTGAFFFVGKGGVG